VKHTYNEKIIGAEWRHTCNIRSSVPLPTGDLPAVDNSLNYVTAQAAAIANDMTPCATYFLIFWSPGDLLSRKLALGTTVAPALPIPESMTSPWAVRREVNEAWTWCWQVCPVSLSSWAPAAVQLLRYTPA